MGILIGRGPVRGPARVADADRARRRRLGQFFLQQVDAARRLYDGKLTLGSDRHDTGTVVAAVLQSVESFDEEIHCFTMADITDNSTHEKLRSMRIVRCAAPGESAAAMTKNWPCTTSPWSVYHDPRPAATRAVQGAGLCRPAN